MSRQSVTKRPVGKVIDESLILKFNVMENSQRNEEQEEKNATAPTTAASPEPAEEAEGQDNDIMKFKEEVAEMKDKYIRLYSEFENFKRRTGKEKREMIQSANEQLIQSLLPVADDFHRAEKALNESKNQDVEGFLLIQNKFNKILELHGLQRMDVGRGSDFDTDRHEAISQVPAPEDALKGKIVDVVENGYLLKDKVIRFAKVVVGG